MTTIIIPLYNEESNVHGLLREIKRLRSDIKWILVSNGCNDGTYSRLSVGIDELSLSNVETLFLSTNKGYGHGIKKGLEKGLISERDLIGWTHGDGQTAVSDVLMAIESSDQRRGLSLVKGARVARHDKLAGSLFTQLQNLLLRLYSFSYAIQPNAQPTLASAELVKSVYRHCEDDGMFDLSFVLESKRLGASIRRFDVVFRERVSGRGSNERLSSKILFATRNLSYILRFTLKEIIK